MISSRPFIDLSWEELRSAEDRSYTQTMIINWHRDQYVFQGIWGFTDDLNTYLKQSVQEVTSSLSIPNCVWDGSHLLLFWLAIIIKLNSPRIHQKNQFKISFQYRFKDSNTRENMDIPTDSISSHYNLLQSMHKCPVAIIIQYDGYQPARQPGVPRHLALRGMEQL